MSGRYHMLGCGDENGHKSRADAMLPRVLVMMATYNGARYLAEQIDSILAQKDVEITLRICDDCSTDATPSICRAYADSHPNVIVSHNVRTLGVAENFMQMVYEQSAAGYDYYAFSDQDDVWLPEKLRIATDALARLGNATPALYYSDATNFDGARWWSEVAPYCQCESHPNTLLVRNWVPGCTEVFNRPLQSLLAGWQPSSFPRIHDVWVHCVARYCGTVIADFDHAPILRRITGYNVVGAQQDHHVSLGAALKDIRSLLGPPSAAPTRTVEALLEGYREKMSEQTISMLEGFLSYRRTLLTRVRFARSFDFYQPTWRGRALVRLCFLFGRC